MPFTVKARHDLLDHPDLFGLRTATDASQGHFPGISAEPLAVQAAAQAMTATFGARGFRSGAVTAFAMMAGGIPRHPFRAREISARFDRPFGFLALHRTSRLVLNAGWVVTPTPSRKPPGTGERSRRREAAENSARHWGFSTKIISSGRRGRGRRGRCR
ncbi:hypothetical protein ACR6C2_36255 [Streptomyces sp. INA 01156]